MTRSRSASSGSRTRRRSGGCSWTTGAISTGETSPPTHSSSPRTASGSATSAGRTGRPRSRACCQDARRFTGESDGASPPRRQPVVEVDGDRATASSTWVYITRDFSDNPVLSLIGHYRRRPTRTDGGWKFLRREAYLDFPYSALDLSDVSDETLARRRRAGTPAESVEVLDAVVARLIPADEVGPGAREAGVVDYIERALAGDYRECVTGLRGGLGRPRRPLGAAQWGAVRRARARRPGCSAPRPRTRSDGRAEGREHSSTSCSGTRSRACSAIRPGAAMPAASGGSSSSATAVRGSSGVSSTRRLSPTTTALSRTSRCRRRADRPGAAGGSRHTC